MPNVAQSMARGEGLRMRSRTRVTRRETPGRRERNADSERSVDRTGPNPWPWRFAARVSDQAHNTRPLTDSLSAQIPRDPKYNLSEVSAALSGDPSLVSKVLGMANSAACAPRRTITKVSEAITLIGLKNLLSLVFGLSIGGIFNKMGLAPTEAKGM